MRAIGAYNARETRDWGVALCCASVSYAYFSTLLSVSAMAMGWVDTKSAPMEVGAQCA
jgi:hypothetical protein